MIKLPPLPEPKKYFGIDAEPDFSYYTADQMHEYAAAAYRAGLEAAALVCEVQSDTGSINQQWMRERCAEAIRNLEISHD